MPQTRSILDSIREDVNLHSPVVLTVAPFATSVRPLTPANCSLRFLETGAPGSPCVPVLSSRAAVPGTCIASTDLLEFIDPLPMDRIALHDHQTDRRQLLTVAHRQCRGLNQVSGRPGGPAGHLCRRGDESVPLLTIETFPH